ncbi:serine hydrolase domain-containing protein [Streptomyces sp. ICC1]|uniref:serine hydrolase domain-containing protein n=1 Tax=Streptomyces sp. ICC1 TaxID=2099583 RepID=UPI001EF7CE2F|nr:serine hydrolase domain-containing protein [Streptomyces sp. ICC1]
MQHTHSERHRRARRTAAAAAVLLALLAGAAPAATAAAGPGASDSAARGLDRESLTRRLDAVRDAGMYGSYASVRDGRARWDGATGVADTATGRPTRPGMRHRVGSVTKSFTSVAVLQLSAKGRIGLDRPVGDYLPELLPGERGRKVTVRMLLNHTSGLPDYVAEAFPSFKENSPRSLDEFRHRTIAPEVLIGYGVGAPQLFEPGTDWSYSNTNYLLLGELIREVTGKDPERVITENVIRGAGLKDTYFPGTDPRIKGPHSKLYENFGGLIDPPRDYSEYNMTMAGTAGALISTTQDLNTFYRALFQGGLLPAAQLREMKTAVPVKDGSGTVVMGYGLGVYTVDTSCGPVWGHDGAVWGSGTQAMSTPDGKRQVALGINLMGYQRTDAQGRPVPHPVDAALAALREQALCGAAPRAGAAAEPKGPAEPLDTLLLKGALPSAPPAPGQRLR